jgi:DNA polymerase III subunit gamma/tau
MSTSNEVYDLNSLREAVADALTKAGHKVAAEFIQRGAWIATDQRLSIEVSGIGKRMLGLTVNTEAEKIIRQELQRLGGPREFMVIPSPAVPIV